MFGNGTETTRAFESLFIDDDHARSHFDFRSRNLSCILQRMVIASVSGMPLRQLMHIWR